MRAFPDDGCRTPVAGDARASATCSSWKARCLTTCAASVAVAFSLFALGNGKWTRPLSCENGIVETVLIAKGYGDNLRQGDRALHC